MNKKVMWDVVLELNRFFSSSLTHSFIFICSEFQRSDIADSGCLWSFKCLSQGGGWSGGE